MRFVLATRNPHKLRELSALLEGACELEPLPEGVELPPETGATFADNALAKAVAAAAATGSPALADDSGIEVAALGGAPGVRSARYAGEDAGDDQNLAHLLHETEGAVDRRAAYVCALALAWPDGEEELFEARCEGRLTSAPRGEGGFGYDPIFVADQYARNGDGPTMAELSPAQKDEVSHRGRAARLVSKFLEAL